jgi:hypothetical protein
MRKPILIIDDLNYKIVESFFDFADILGDWFELNRLKIVFNLSLLKLLQPYTHLGFQHSYLFTRNIVDTLLV